MSSRQRLAKSRDNSGLVRHRGLMDDAFDLERFVVAQDLPGTLDDYEAATKELRTGRKVSHWMWFVFPQLRELGFTAYAKRYGIGSRDEATAYLAHEVLGPRLRRCARLVVGSGAVSANRLMGGHPDDQKLKSSMTLFAEVADDDGDFVAVLDKYFRGERDRETLKLLAPRPTSAAEPESEVRRAPRKWRRWRRK